MAAILKPRTRTSSLINTGMINQIMPNNYYRPDVFTEEVVIILRSVFDSRIDLSSVIEVINKQTLDYNQKVAFGISIELQSGKELSLSSVMDAKSVIDLISEFSLGIESPTAYTIQSILESRINLLVPMLELTLFLVELAHGTPYNVSLAIKGGGNR